MISPISTTIRGFRRHSGGWRPTRPPSRSRDWSCGIWPAAWTGTRSRRCREGWANGYELTLAKDFVEHLDTLPEGETGRLLFEVEGTDAASEAIAAEVRAALRRKMVLGLLAEVGIPARPEGPAVAFRVRMSASEAQVHGDRQRCDRTRLDYVRQVYAASRRGPRKIGRRTICRWIGGRHAQSLGSGRSWARGSRTRGRCTIQLRIDNASPLVLNGLAALGTDSKPDETPKVLSGICLSPRRSMTVPASEEVVKSLGLKKGIKLVALDLSGLVRCLGQSEHAASAGNGSMPLLKSTASHPPFGAVPSRGQTVLWRPAGRPSSRLHEHEPPTQFWFPSPSGEGWGARRHREPSQVESPDAHHFCLLALMLGGYRSFIYSPLAPPLSLRTGR